MFFIQSLSVLMLYPDGVSVQRPSSGKQGQGLVEYALILLMVAVVVVAILTLFGPQVGSLYSEITCMPDC